MFGGHTKKLKMQMSCSSEKGKKAQISKKYELYIVKPTVTNYIPIITESFGKVGLDPLVNHLISRIKN